MICKKENIMVDIIKEQLIKESLQSIEKELDNKRKERNKRKAAARKVRTKKNK